MKLTPEELQKKHQYTTGQAAKILNINLKRLTTYIDRGFIVPYIPATGRGKGREAVLGVLNLVKARVLIDLADAGFSLKLASEIADRTAELNPKYQHKYKYITVEIDIVEMLNANSF